MRWTSGVARRAMAVGAAVLVAGGVGLAVRAQPGEATFVRSEPPASPGTTAPAPTQPAPGPTVTLTPRPTPVRAPTILIPKPTPSRSTTPRPSPSAPSALVPPATPVAPPTLDFTLSSFNVLGSSHTSATGKRPGMAPGTVRARWAAQLIQRHGADVVGFQELQADQLATLVRYTNMDFYPGSSMRRPDTENSIGWRRDRWVAVEKHTVTIPYFNGNARQMPYVRLRHLATGIEAWFANFHNPADTRQFPRQSVFRSRATDIEITLANRLVRQTHTPVFFTGDMNERDSYFCRLTGAAPMVAARGGTNDGECRPDDPRAVDWIFGSRGVSFTDYLEDRSALVDRATDHPLLVARARLVGGTSAVPGLAGAAGSD